MTFPRLYAIADADLLRSRNLDLLQFVSELHAAGIVLLQYRDKTAGERTILRNTASLREAFPAKQKLKLILNDRADLALLSHSDGVHVGQDDLSADDARRIVGLASLVGVSTHSVEQLMAAEETSCDYIAYGPVFPTSSKANPDPTVGLAGLRAARTRTRKPLVAIGGITRENCRSVIDAGADSVAVISGLIPTSAGRSARQIAEEFLACLR